MKGTKKVCSLVLVVAMSGTAMMPANQIQAVRKQPKLNKTTVSMVVGETIKLNVKKNKKKVTWTTSNKNVAKVSKKGKVTAVSIGTAKVTAKVAKKKYVCKVTVTPVSKDVKNHFAKLKKYVVSNGQLNDANNKYIQGKYGENLTVSISYDARNKAYVFESDFQYESGDGVCLKNRVKMVMSESNLAGATLENTVNVGNYDATLMSTEDVSGLNGENGPAWTVQMANPSDGSVKWVTFAKARWGMGYAGWRLLLLETLAFDMDDLGFRKR